MRNRPLMIALAVMGLLAVGLTAMTMMNPGTPAVDPNVATVETVATPEPTIAKQVFALRDIPPRTLITKAMVMEREVDSDSIAPNSLRSVNDVVGKLSNSKTIQQGQPLLASSVITPLQRVIPANFEVPTGLRAVAVYVDPNSTAAGLVDIGDRVDVISTYKLTTQKQDTERYTQVVVGSPSFVSGRTVAQDLLVLAVDSSIQRPPAEATPTPAAGAPAVPGAPAAPAPPAPTPTPAVTAVKIRVVIAATPAVAARLVAAQESGTIHLTIRNPNSREQSPVSESREYPSRVVNVPKRNTNTINQAREAMTSFERGMNSYERIASGSPGGRGLTPTDVPTLGSVPPAIPSSNGAGASSGTTGGMPSPSGGVLTPSGPSGSEVTVIRGTDKSKVTVPGN